MIRSFSVLAIIPARGGSKGIPRKNLKILGGEPLITWTIEAAQGSSYVDKVLVTSDDNEILRISEDRGAVTILRPHDLATDSALASQVILHCLEEIPGFDIIIYLQPTSPFRTSRHIDNALEELVSHKESGTYGVVSVVETDSAPEHMYQSGIDGFLVKLLPKQERRRQDIPATYLLNGAIYCAFKDSLLSVAGQFGQLQLRAIIMHKWDSFDIDDPSDFEAVKMEFENRARPTKKNSGETFDDDIGQN